MANRIIGTKLFYLVWLIALLPVMILRDFTPNNELRYLSIVDEALRDGHLFTFTLDGEIYADKPPLSFWLMMIGRKLLGGHHMWYYSLLSFLPATVVVMTMEKWLRRERIHIGNEGMLMLTTAAMFLGMTVTIRMDMLMVMFITLALYTFFKIYRGEGSQSDRYLFPHYTFLALFSKGPVGLLAPLLSTLVFLLYRKKMATWKLYWGWRSWLVLLLGCAIWFTGVYLEGGNEYLHNLVVHQTVDRGVNAFHHKEPFYYYLLSVWYVIAPWMFLSIGLLIAGVARKKITAETERFFLAVILTTMAMLSLISSKLAVYLLPAVPFLIYLPAMLLDKFDGKNIWPRLSVAIPAFLLIFAFPSLFVLEKNENLSYIAVPLVFIAAGIASCGGIIAIWSALGRKKIRQSINVLAITLLLTVFVAGWALPRLNPWLGWENLCTEAKQIATEKETSGFRVYGIKRAGSMDVFLGEEAKEATEEEITQNLIQGQLLLLSDKSLKRNSQIAKALSDKEQQKIGPYWIIVL